MEDYNDLVKELDDNRCKIQRGEAVEVVGGVQQLIYLAESAITQLQAERNNWKARYNKLDEALQMNKHEVEDLRAQVGMLSEVNERYGRMIDHLQDEI